MDFKNEVAKLINKSYNQFTLEEILETIEIPAKSDMGDFAYPCFRLAKEFKKAPPMIAQDLANNIEKNNIVVDIKALGGYVNFFINEELYSKEILTELWNNPKDYGKQNIGNGRKIVIDYSAPNIAKPFHVGHLRSTVIGNALYNIYNMLGYTSFGINYLGDWGTQFGKLIVAYKMWGDKSAVDEHGITELTRIYVKFHDEAEKNDKLNDKARSWLVKMQNGDKEALELWQWFKDISLKEFQKVYDRLDITFDSYQGESYYNDKMQPVVDELIEKNILVESNGAKIVDLEEFNMPPCLILRSDGGTLYPTRDIASALHRKNVHDFEKAIYITAVDQNLHFAQWFKVLDIMGYEWAKDLVHVGFGLVSLDSGKLSTRKGHVILMEELLAEAVKKTREIMETSKGFELDNKDEVAEDVGIGAVIFHDLFNSRIKDVVFSWDKVLNFDGESGPYVQYTHARCHSVLEKIGGVDFDQVDFNLITDSSSKEIVKLLYSYPDKLVEAAYKNEPFIITRYLVDVTKAFNKFYNDNKINVEDIKLKNSRGIIVFAVKNILSNGLNLLGIKAPERM